MKLLNKYKLNFESTFKYVDHELKDINALSIETLNLLDFKNGYFFTLLPEGANLERLYDFNGGCILPQFPEVKYVHEGIKSTYTPIPDIVKELAQLILIQIQKNNKYSCIFDDVNSSFSNVCSYHFFVNHGLIHKEEIYYFLENKIASHELIMTSLKDSTTFWHSLGLLTTADFSDVSKELSREKIQDVCLKTELVIVGAYDGEGYVFWEKNSSPIPFGGPSLA